MDRPTLHWFVLCFCEILINKNKAKGIIILSRRMNKQSSCILTLSYKKLFGRKCLQPDIYA